MHEHSHAPEHGHTHGLVAPSIVRSRAGIRAVALSLAVLTVTVVIQSYLYARTLSVALLADLIHNFGDALTAVPLGVAFFLRSARGERLAGLFVVLTLLADGSHARVDGFVSLGVLASAGLVAIGLDAADPLVGLAITAVILKITWDSWHTVRGGATHSHA
jgi:divalent metal cation (Fe/Co/Zn/Cd) transporter